VASYDLGRPSGHRLVAVTVGGRPLDPARIYRVATSSFLTQGGDLYETFLRTKRTDSGRPMSEVVIGYFERTGEVPPPKMGRLIPATP
jgi:2',3'-cyclic-nucleotide 2'-phosphodiesterase (5'-nucleotidase family)